MYEESRRLYTEEINAAVRGAKAAGATEIVVMDCHGAGERMVVQLTDPRAPRRGLRLRRPGRVDGVHGLPGGRRRRRAVRRHACDGGHAHRRHEPHRVRPGMAEPLVQRRARRGNRHQRGSVRRLGLPGAARDGGRGSVRRGTRAPRPGARDGAGQAGHHVAVRSQRRATACAEADRGRIRSARSRISSAVEPYLPGSPCEIQVEYKTTLAPDKLRHRQGIERVSDRMIVSRAETWWDAWRQFFF